MTIYFMNILYIGSFATIVFLKRGVEKRKCYPEIVMAALA